jgi:pseudouridine kinase
MTPAFERVIAIGAATVDRFGTTLEAEARLATSNIGEVTTGFGGAARNVAETLARLAVPVRLVTALGGDADGAAIAGSARAAGFALDSVATGTGAASASYTAIFSGAGDLVIGLADMGVLEALTPEALAPHLGDWGKGVLVFADANLPDATLAWLAEDRRGPLAAAAVSVQKSRRLAPILMGLDLLFLNRLEGEAILAGPAMGPDDLADALARHGAAAGILTLGARGAVAWEGPSRRAVAPVGARVRNVNGAGDAVAGTVLAALAGGRPLAEAAGLAMAAAALTVESDLTVRPDLSAALVAARLAALHIEPEGPR